MFDKDKFQYALQLQPVCGVAVFKGEELGWNGCDVMQMLRDQVCLVGTFLRWKRRSA